MAVQLRIQENGGVCCSTFNDAGERVAPEHPCPACKAHFASLETQESNMEDFTPPDPFAADLAKLRDAMAIPENRFEEQYKAERLRDLDAECVQLDAHIARTPSPRLTAAELAEFAAPDGYQIALDRMRRASGTDRTP